MSVEPLTDLVALINEEHALTYYSIIDALEHAIACGEALIAAKATIEEGHWTEWCENNLEMESGAVSRYVRIATYKDHLRAASDRPQSISGAMKYLRAIEAPGVRPRSTTPAAARLRREKAEQRAVNQQQVDQEVADTKHPLAGVYDLLRSCEFTLDFAISEADVETTETLETAVTYIHRAEDAVMKALGIKRKKRHRREEA